MYRNMIIIGIVLLFSCSLVDAALTTSIREYWKLDTTLIGELGRSNAVLTYGGTNTTGIINGGIDLDGGNDLINLGTNANLGNVTAFTWNLWMKSDLSLNEFTENDGIMSNNPYNTCKGVELRVTTSDTIELFGGNACTGSYISTSANEYNTEAWQMYSVTYGLDDKLRLYINGTLEGASSGFTLTATTYDVFVGDSPYNSGREMPGLFDEIGIWHRELNASELLQLYNSGAGKQYPFAVADTCTYSGTGNWIITNNCNISSTVNLATGAAMIISANKTVKFSSAGLLI